jgi:hypothetical protein
MGRSVPTSPALGTTGLRLFGLFSAVETAGDASLFIVALCFDGREHTMPYPQIIVTGDSIAQLSFQKGGYGSLLCDVVGLKPARMEADFQYNGKADVVNRGMGGYNSQQLLAKFRQRFVPKDPSVRLFIIHIGTNDR